MELKIDGKKRPLFSQPWTITFSLMKVEKGLGLASVYLEKIGEYVVKITDIYQNGTQIHFGGDGKIILT